MAGRITPTDAPLRRIRDVGPAAPRVDPSAVAEALGAEGVEGTIPTERSPVTLFQLRAELATRLQSSGGRPALTGASRRVKIPVTDREWEELVSLAAFLSDMGFAPSPGQVASALLSLSIPLARDQDERVRSRLAR